MAFQMDFSSSGKQNIFAGYDSTVSVVVSKLRRTVSQAQQHNVLSSIRVINILFGTLSFEFICCATG